ncbi:hypothetical protein, partial [Collinsella sp. Sow4_E3]|uniref:hypothetical protein n=1 Tax=Collinsella sp. Sow4_E3 TaxID=3438776 RepID=UPI003F91C494
TGRAGGRRHGPGRVVGLSGLHPGHQAGKSIQGPGGAVQHRVGGPRLAGTVERYQTVIFLELTPSNVSVLSSIHSHKGYRRKDKNMNATYSTKNEAIAAEVIAVINSGMADADDYDVDAIADEVLGDYGDGYALQVEDADFWAIVAKHARN